MSEREDTCVTMADYENFFSTYNSQFSSRAHDVNYLRSRYLAAYPMLIYYVLRPTRESRLKILSGNFLIKNIISKQTLRTWYWPGSSFVNSRQHSRSPRPLRIAPRCRDLEAPQKCHSLLSNFAQWPSAGHSPFTYCRLAQREYRQSKASATRRIRRLHLKFARKSFFAQGRVQSRSLFELM